MRIALYHNLPSGGAKRAVFEWAQRLAAKHMLDVFTLSNANHAFCDLRPFVHAHRVFDFAPHRLLASPFGRLNQLQRWRDLAVLEQLDRRIAQEINSGGYDVVFAQPCIYTLIPGVMRFLRVPSVYYLHEPFGRITTRAFVRPYLKQNRWRMFANRIDPLIRMYRRRLERTQTRSVQCVTQLLANSEFTRAQILRQFNLDAPVVHYGVNTEKFRPRVDVAKTNAVISVGEMSPRKGFDFLVASLALIPAAQRPALTLVCNSQIAEERAYIESLAAANGIALCILVNLNTEQLAIEYNRAPVCVYAPVAEPFGFVPLEAMACGTPVVGVSEGGVCESVRGGETGILTERDPRKFADAIIALLSNPAHCSELGAQARSYVETEWWWDQSAHAIENYLRETAQR